MPVPDQNGRARINNLRASSQAKEILEQIKQYRASKGHIVSQNQLFVEAVFEHFKPELAKIRKLKAKPPRATAAA